ncbi:MAG: hypothetical protein AAFV25_28010, partial [Bacteroidota bacterium]
MKDSSHITLGTRAFFLFALSYFLFLPSMHSQDNSLDRARQIAQHLLEKDVFTTASRDLMLERINNGSLSTNRKVQQADGSYKVEQGDISHSKLLQFVAAVFQSEMSYRAGIFEYGRIINQLEQEGMTAPKTDDQEQLKAYFEQLNKEAEKRLESFEGRFIEERIPSEDSVPPQNRTFYAGGLGLGQRGMDTGGLIAPHRSVYGRTITRNLNDMAVAGLLDSTLLQDCFAQVKAKVHLMEVDVLTYASKALLTQEEFPRKLKAQQQLIQRLIDAEMMVSSTGKRLIEQCKQGQLKSKFELLSYCRYTRLFDLSHSRENLLDGYRRIFKDLNEILPDITVKDVQINLRAEEIDWRDGEFFIRGDLKLTAQDRDYYDFVTHDVMAAKDTITDPERLPIKSVRGINSIVNKILRDQQSDQRLYIAQDEDAEKNNDGFSQKFGLLLLTQEQYKAWQLRPYNDFMPQVSHDNAFHSDAVQSIFAQYQELGLMNHLTEEERTNAWRDIQRKTIDSYQSIIG